MEISEATAVVQAVGEMVVWTVVGGLAGMRRRKEMLNQLSGMQNAQGSIGCYCWGRKSPGWHQITGGRRGHLLEGGIPG